MRLAARFTVALVLGILLVLGGNAAFRIHRELALFQADSRRDGVLLGRALARAMERLWADVGEGPARKFLEDVAVREHSLEVRWLQFEGPSEDHVIPPDVLDPLSQGTEVALRREDASESEKFYTYVPVFVAGKHAGAIEVRESLAADRTYIRETILQSLVATGALVVVCGAFAMVLGVWFVGRPVQTLVEQARRIGRGDLEGDLELKQSDELGELAREMNAMCGELRRANEAFLREAAGRIATVDQLRHADRLKTVGALASGIAHELGTPLNVVSGRAQLILSEHAPGTTSHENAAIVVAQTRRMALIIRQLLDYARRRHTARSAQDSGQLVEQTATLLSSLAEKHDVTIRVHQDGPTFVTADPGQIQQCLTNLIMNAIQSMPKGGTVTVEIGPRRVRPTTTDVERDYLCLAVKDDGEGMARDVLLHIFDPFFTTKKAGEGTGLGLSISQQIVRDHGGWIDVDSKPGQGSCFTIYLPMGEEP